MYGDGMTAILDPARYYQAALGRDRRFGAALVVRLPYRPPLEWTELLAFLARRATPGVEAVGDGVYRRTIALGDASGTIEVRAAAGQPHLLMRVRLARPERLLEVVGRARRLFDLDADPALIAEHLAASPVLAPLVARRPGLRVPGAWDAFELAVRAVLGQQVTVRGATTLAGRLARAFGTSVGQAEEGLTHLFPGPEALAGADLASIGLPGARAATIRALAGAAARGALVLDAARGLEDAVARLRAIPGIGAWTAHYVALRALGEPDAFPAADLGLRRALGNGAGPLAPARVAELAEAWRPWRAYATLHLWSSLGKEESP
jgi:AraC family transcriptional regulator of adaptative response / DNA-3-methyladenine glycosylase II